jgi:hypothetical protein
MSANSGERGLSDDHDHDGDLDDFDFDFDDDFEAESEREYTELDESDEWQFAEKEIECELQSGGLDELDDE